MVGDSYHMDGRVWYRGGMDKYAALQILRNCLTVLGVVTAPLRLWEKASGVEMEGYTWIGISFVCLLIGILWTMHEREIAAKKEAENNFFQRYPEYKDYKYFWELYGLYHFGKSLSDSMSPERFIQWKLEIQYCLNHWGETKNKDFGLNLPPHATIADYLEKLSETLSYHAKTISF